MLQVGISCNARRYPELTGKKLKSGEPSDRDGSRLKEAPNIWTVHGRVEYFLVHKRTVPGCSRRANAMRQKQWIPASLKTDSGFRATKTRKQTANKPRAKNDRLAHTYVIGSGPRGRQGRRGTNNVCNG